MFIAFSMETKVILKKIALHESLTHKNKFEQNSLDIFLIDLAEIGKLKKMTLGHDNKNLGASWFVDFVDVVNLGTNEKYVFKCGQWFDKDRGDKKIERELEALDVTEHVKF